MKSSAKETAPIRTTFSLYANDLDIVSKLRGELREQGLRIDRVKTLRGLVHITAESELLAHTVLQFKADEAKKGPREEEMVDERISVILPAEDKRKLDNVVDELDLKRIKVSSSYVLRALIRSLPPVATILKPLTKFTEKQNAIARELANEARAATRAAKAAYAKKKR
ncbi:MAG: hypothetical protein LBK99_25890 [Opitutaceae bacterium]|jgi:hypothetical protein|nr:hypothetical protein [Opitutaceae bacterium]